MCMTDDFVDNARAAEAEAKHERVDRWGECEDCQAEKAEQRAEDAREHLKEDPNGLCPDCQDEASRAKEEQDADDAIAPETAAAERRLAEMEDQR